MASLVGTKLPDIELQASDGSMINLARQSGTTVVFCYPFTGRPGHPNPPGWDDIPGAHGSTQQILSFSTLYHDFAALQVKVFGLSLLSSEWQQDFVSRNGLPFLLLSDADQKFSSTLELETFGAGQNNYLCRRNIIFENGTIRHDIFPVLQPERNAADMLAHLTP